MRNHVVARVVMWGLSASGCAFDSSGLAEPSSDSTAEGTSTVSVDPSDDPDDPDDTDDTTGAPAPTHAEADGSASDSSDTGEPCSPTLEICDGIDNDCDGATDEWSRLNQTCGTCTTIVGTTVQYVCAGELSWSAAQSACEALGADLLTVSTVEENQAVVLALVTRNISLAWIGLHEHGLEDHWEWMAPEGVELYQWGAGQPDDQPGDEDCVAIHASTQLWHDALCINDSSNPDWRIDGWLCEAPNMQ